MTSFKRISLFIRGGGNEGWFTVHLTTKIRISTRDRSQWEIVCQFACQIVGTTRSKKTRQDKHILGTTDYKKCSLSNIIVPNALVLRPMVK